MDQTGWTDGLEARVTGLAGRARPQLEEARRRLQSMNQRVMSFVQDHPAACLLGATAIGYLLARLARRQRS